MDDDYCPACGSASYFDVQAGPRGKHCDQCGHDGRPMTDDKRAPADGEEDPDIARLRELSSPYERIAMDLSEDAHRLLKRAHSALAKLDRHSAPRPADQERGPTAGELLTARAYRKSPVELHRMFARAVLRWRDEVQGPLAQLEEHDGSNVADPGSNPGGPTRMGAGGARKGRPGSVPGGVVAPGIPDSGSTPDGSTSEPPPPPPPADPEPCEHDWVSARSEGVESGLICRKCRALASEDGETVIPVAGPEPVDAEALAELIEGGGRMESNSYRRCLADRVRALAAERDEARTNLESLKANFECIGSVAERQRARAEKAEAEVGRLREAGERLARHATTDHETEDDRQLSLSGALEDWRAALCGEEESDA